MPRSTGFDHPAAHGRWCRMLWFVLVGSVAALVHWISTVVLVEHGAVGPWWANMFGWLVALSVSFTGHYRLTFQGHDSPVRLAAMRFFLVSATGFGLNAVIYASLLHWDPVHYQLWLAATLVVVAGLTYLLSHRWAFLSSPPGG